MKKQTHTRTQTHTHTERRTNTESRRTNTETQRHRWTQMDTDTHTQYTTTVYNHSEVSLRTYTRGCHSFTASDSLTDPLTHSPFSSPQLPLVSALASAA